MLGGNQLPRQESRRKGQIVSLPSLGGYSHTWAWYGGFAVMTPIFYPIGSPFMPHHDLIDTLFLQNIFLSLSHLVPEILGPKNCLICCHNVLFNSF